MAMNTAGRIHLGYAPLSIDGAVVSFGDGENVGSNRADALGTNSRVTTTAKILMDTNMAASHVVSACGAEGSGRFF